MEADPDDDNDGLSDEDEVAKGSDPLPGHGRRRRVRRVHRCEFVFFSNAENRGGTAFKGKSIDTADSFNCGILSDGRVPAEVMVLTVVVSVSQP